MTGQQMQQIGIKLTHTRWEHWDKIFKDKIARKWHFIGAFVLKVPETTTKFIGNKEKVDAMMIMTLPNL